MKAILQKTAVAAGIAIGALGMLAAPAAAATVTTTSASVSNTDSGFSWTVDFICSTALPCVGGDPGQTLAASAVFTLTSVTTGLSSVQWGINLVLSNTSAAGVAGALTAMGFDTDPNSTMSDFIDSAVDGIVFSGGAGGAAGIPAYQTELCVWDGNNCQAANDKTMTAGTSDTMSFVLNTALGVTDLTFSNFAVKFAGAGLPNSFEFGGTIGDVPAPVPLPAAGGLLLAGLGGLALLRRKKNAA